MIRFLEQHGDLVHDSQSAYYYPSGIARSTFFYLYGVGEAVSNHVLSLSNQNDCRDGYLLLVTLSGHGLLHYRSRVLKLLPDTACFLSCAEDWQLEARAGSDWHFAWVHFDGQNCLGYYHQYTRRSRYEAVELDGETRLLSTMAELLRLQCAGLSTLELEYRSSLALDVLLTEMVLRSIAYDPIMNVIPKYIHDAAFIIDNEYEKPLSLENVAARVGVSPYYLSRRFKAHIGRSFKEYLRWYRIEQAKRYLRESEYSVEQICYLCGMRTVSHFINAFRAQEGITPLAYRKKWQTETFYPDSPPRK